jgi:hypothetical protein
MMFDAILPRKAGPDHAFARKSHRSMRTHGPFAIGEGPTGLASGLA